MSAVSVLLAARDEAIGERIATALKRVGHTARVLPDGAGTHDIDDDAAIVVWSNAALKLARLHDQARMAFDGGRLIPVAVGGAPAPEGFETLQAVDLSGWQGDDRDPRWRFVLEEIGIAESRRRVADQEIWLQAQQNVIAQDAPPVVDAEPEPVRQPPEQLYAPTPPRRRRRKSRRFDPASVAVGGVMALCVLAGVVIIAVPVGGGSLGVSPRIPSLDSAADQPIQPVDLAVLQPAAPPADDDLLSEYIADPTLAPGELREVTAEAALTLSELPATDDRPASQGRDEVELAVGPAQPAPNEPVADAPSQPATMEEILSALPELNAAGTDETNSAARTNNVAAPGEAFRDCEACPEMLAVPAGTFVMGAAAAEGGRPSERPQTSVTLDTSFAIAAHETTFAQWDACVADGGCAGYRPGDAGWGRAAQPVIGVSYDDATAYTRWLSARTGMTYRLPSEAEWEYAARAGSPDAFSWGDRLQPGAANYDARYPYRGTLGTARGRPVAAGSFEANPWGLYNMHGNLWEWTADCWTADHSGRGRDAAPRTGNCSQRVLKGGAFNTGGWRLRAGHRIGKPRAAREQEFGFRVVREL